MPALVYFSIVGDVLLLHITGGMDDMNVRGGWDIHIAVVHCWNIGISFSASMQKQQTFP